MLVGKFASEGGGKVAHNFWRNEVFNEDHTKDDMELERSCGAGEHGGGADDHADRSAAYAESVVRERGIIKSPVPGIVGVY